MVNNSSNIFIKNHLRVIKLKTGLSTLLNQFQDQIGKKGKTNSLETHIHDQLLSWLA